MTGFLARYSKDLISIALWWNLTVSRSIKAVKGPCTSLSAMQCEYSQYRRVYSETDLDIPQISEHSLYPGECGVH
jgi:hypothetical protein